MPAASGLVRARLARWMLFKPEIPAGPARVVPWHKSAQESGSKLTSPAESRLFDLLSDLSNGEELLNL
jgi:hypothetical protein